MLSTAELAFERGRPDIAVPMLREIEHLDLAPLEVARARWLSELMDARALADHSRVTGLIATAEQAGAAGDRELHHSLLWITAARTWWSNPSPDVRQLIVDAANRAGPPTAADPQLVSIHAYADPHANASKVLDCLRDAADGGVPDGDRAGNLASAGLVVGAFYDSLTFCASAIDSARAEGRLGVLPRLLARQAILAVRLPDWDIAIPAAEEARRLASELGQPIWLATAETAIALGGGVEHLAHLAREAGLRERLLDERGVGTDDPVAEDRLVGVARHEQHPQPGEQRRQALGEHAAADVGHHDVGEEQVDAAGVLAHRRAAESASGAARIR